MISKKSDLMLMWGIKLGWVAGWTKWLCVFETIAVRRVTPCHHFLQIRCGFAGVLFDSNLLQSDTPTTYQTKQLEIENKVNREGGLPYKTKVLLHGVLLLNVEWLTIVPLGQLSIGNKYSLQPLHPTKRYSLPSPSLNVHTCQKSFTWTML